MTHEPRQPLRLTPAQERDIAICRRGESPCQGIVDENGVARQLRLDGDLDLVERVIEWVSSRRPGGRWAAEDPLDDDDGSGVVDDK
jgi:hypothetical protein